MTKGIAKKIVYYLCLVVLFLIFICSLLTVNNISSVTDLYEYIPIYLCIFISLSLLLYLFIKLSKRINKNIIYITYFILIFIIPFTLYKLSIANVIFDGKEVFDFTFESLKGNYQQVFKGSYMAIFPLQYGLSLFWTIIIKICAIFNSQLIYNYSACLNIISFIHAVMTSLILLFAFLIIKRLSKNNESDKCVYVFLSLTCLPLFLFFLILYSDIPSILFLMISTYFFIVYIQNKIIKYMLLSVLFIGAAMALRFNAAVFAIAFMLILIYHSLFEKRKIMNAILAVLFLIIPVIISRIPYKYYEIVSNYKNMVNTKEYQIDDGEPLLLCVSMGLDINGGNYGWYNGKTMHTYVDICGLDSSCGEEKAREQISESLKTMSSDPLLTLDFFYHKMASQWGDGSMGALNISPATENIDRTIVNFIYRGTSNIILKCYAKAHLILVTLLALLLMIKKRKVRELSILELTFEIIVLGGFMASIFWETNSRYNLPYLYILIILASTNIERLKHKTK